jgi:hypothetical protein
MRRVEQCGAPAGIGMPARPTPTATAGGYAFGMAALQMRQYEGFIK